MQKAQIITGEPIEIESKIQNLVFLLEDSNIHKENRRTKFKLLISSSLFLLMSLILLALWNVFLTEKIKISGIEREGFKKNIGRIEVLEKANRNFMKDALKHKALSLCFWELIGKYKEKYNDGEIQNCIQLVGIAEAKYGHKGLDAPLILSWLEKESNGDPDAISYAGAKGLTQLIDFRAEEIFTEMGYRSNDKKLVFNPVINLAGGLHHLDDLMKFWEGKGIKSQTLVLFYALHSYKWGAGNTEQLFNTGRRAYRPAIEYVNWILNRREWWAEMLKSKMNNTQKLIRQSRNISYGNSMNFGGYDE